MASGLDQGGYVKSANEGPHAAIVVMVRRIGDAVIVAPVRITRPDNRCQSAERGFIEGVARDQVQDRARLVLAGHSGQNRQEISQLIEPLAGRSKPEVRQIVLLLNQTSFGRNPPPAPE